LYFSRYLKVSMSDTAPRGEEGGEVGLALRSGAVEFEVALERRVIEVPELEDAEDEDA
jgi:hypothetical protein